MRVLPHLSASMRAALPALRPALPNTWGYTGCMNLPRFGHTATLLKDGRVLVAGGGKCNNVWFASAEFYDPNAGGWSLTGSMTTVRAYHIAALLKDGRVLVAGGGNGGGPLASAEAYDPNLGTWTPTNSMRTPRVLPMGTLLQDGSGRVLVAGGQGDYSSITGTAELYATAELYDPGTDTWSSTGSMSTPRELSTMTLLADGKTVLVTGGFDRNGHMLDSTELYDSFTGTWTPTGSMSTPRAAHTATLLNDGTVLVVGGWSGVTNLATAELYDPVTHAWTPTGSMSTPRQSPTATLLNDHTVLVVGGNTSAGLLGTAEVYDPPPKGTWELPTNTIGYRVGNTITVLPGGDVLVAGGEMGNTGLTDSLGSAELFRRV